MMVIGFVALLIFGNRLPSVMRSLGKSVTEFKKGVAGIEDDIDPAVTADKKAPTTPEALTDPARTPTRTGSVARSAPMFRQLGPMEMIVVMGVAVLLFGKRLPEVGRSLGKGIVEFKKGLRGIEDEFDRRPRLDLTRLAGHARRRPRRPRPVPKFEPPTSAPVARRPRPTSEIEPQARSRTRDRATLRFRLGLPSGPPPFVTLSVAARTDSPGG